MLRSTSLRATSVGVFGALLTAASLVGFPSPAQAQNARPATPAPESIGEETLNDAVRTGLGLLLSRQESLDPQGPKAEWPYEGVYRVGGDIPIGYRVGGTGIVGLALLRAPGLHDDAPRREALERAASFIIASIKHPLMSHADYAAGYDVRGWGYTYGLSFLLAYENAGLAPETKREEIKSSCAWFVEAIQATAIPEAGGWNYARPRGRERVAPTSPFMTAPTLDALFEAKAKGYAVDDATIEKALAALERSRTPSGSMMYAGAPRGGRADPTPGAVGRMLAAETTLVLAGRGSVASVRGALDAFLTHWDWLEQRRAKTGTHEGPYGVAPYYFFYAHRAAAKAIELLPAIERPEYRRRVNLKLFSVREKDGSWNDRVFPRSAAFGTAMSMLAILEPNAPPAARWTPPAPPKPAIEEPPSSP